MLRWTGRAVCQPARSRGSARSSWVRDGFGRDGVAGGRPLRPNLLSTSLEGSGVGSAVTLVAGVVVLVGSVGWFLFGLATFMARIYPRSAAMLLMVGAAINRFIHVTSGEFIAMAAAVAWLGFFLFRGRGSSAEEPTRGMR